MYMPGGAPAQVRVLLPVLPEGDEWADQVFCYVEGLVYSKMPLLLLATNGANFQGNTRWASLRDHFIGSIAESYVNVVFARGGDRFNVVEDVGKTLQGSALVNLYTEGVVNLAVTTTTPKLTPDEVAALRQYRLVLCPSPTVREALWKLNIPALYAPPSDGSLAQRVAQYIGVKL